MSKNNLKTNWNVEKGNCDTNKSISKKINDSKEEEKISQEQNKETKVVKGILKKRK